jgi:hypothetical protein
MGGKKKPLDKDDFNYYIPLDDDMLSKCLRAHYRAVPRLIKMLYFNSECPKSMNVKYDPKTSDYVFIIKDGSWEAVNKDLLSETLLLYFWTKLCEHFDNIEDLETYKEALCCEETYDRVERFVLDFKEFCDSGDNASWIDQKGLVLKSIAYYTKKLRL